MGFLTGMGQSGAGSVAPCLLAGFGSVEDAQVSLCHVAMVSVRLGQVASPLEPCFSILVTYNWSFLCDGVTKRSKEPMHDRLQPEGWWWSSVFTLSIKRGCTVTWDQDLAHEGCHPPGRIALPLSP